MKHLLLLTLSFLFNLSVLVSICFGQDQRYALIIGITGYPHFPVSEQLKYADDDAKLFRDFIITEEGGWFPSTNIRFLQNHNATHDAIKDGINWISRRVEQEDIVYIFFSGHGVLDDLGLAYFMPYDADPQKADYRGFRTDRFAEELRLKINSRALILFIDACHAGTIYSKGIAKDRVSNITRAFNKAWKNAFKGQDAISMAFLSAASNQRSYEDPKFGRGIFTHYLVQGMKGAADRTAIGNNDDVVTAGELYRYILDKVEYHAKYKLNGKEQSPTKSPEFTSSFPFAVRGNIGEILLNQSEKVRKLFNKANYLWQKGDLDGSSNAYREAVRLDPNGAAAHHNFGLSLKRKGDFNGAIKQYRIALRLDPNYGDAHDNLAVALQNVGDFDEAIREHRAALHFGTTYPQFTHYSLGLALYNKNVLDEAIREYHSAIRIDPYFADAYYNLAAAYEKKGQLLLAADALESSVRLEPNHPDAERTMQRAKRLRKKARK